MRTEQEILNDLYSIAFRDAPKGLGFAFQPPAWQQRMQKWQELQKEAIAARKELEEKVAALTPEEVKKK